MIVECPVRRDASGVASEARTGCPGRWHRAILGTGTAGFGATVAGRHNRSVVPERGRHNGCRGSPQPGPIATSGAHPTGAASGQRPGRCAEPTAVVATVISEASGSRFPVQLSTTTATTGRHRPAYPARPLRPGPPARSPRPAVGLGPLAAPPAGSRPKDHSARQVTQFDHQGPMIRQRQFGRTARRDVAEAAAQQDVIQLSIRLIHRKRGVLGE